MTTGEKLTLFRKKKNLTQEQLAEILNVSRQSVSRWEMDLTFPETEKLIKLSRILECSIDFLLNNNALEEDKDIGPDFSVHECWRFIHECSYFFLATALDNKPRLRPMGFLYSDGRALYISTDRRKNVYSELHGNPHVELASYNLNTGRWIRITGNMTEENSRYIRESMMEMYPLIRQEYVGEKEIQLVIFRLKIETVSIS